MVHTQYIKYGILSGLLLICTIMLSVSAHSESSVFAQITPAPEKFGSNDGATDSSPDTGTGNGNDNPHAITPSEESDETTEDSADSTDSNDVNSEQTPTEQDDQAITTEEQDSDPTSQLVEAIMNEVNEALSASGIIGP
ncbi:MAG: hypothetical protein GEU26_18475 [Nitrososphaeraceae archaeon]|nr:hypothetical protein [Nitrososphaeraceae archaeon]